jgi:hypothetical protein
MGQIEKFTAQEHFGDLVPHNTKNLPSGNVFAK